MIFLTLGKRDIMEIRTKIELTALEIQNANGQAVTNGSLIPGDYCIVVE